MGMKDLAARLSHTGFARFLQGMNYSAGLLRHERELQQVYDMLADELSRETFRVVISTCKSGDYSGMHKYNPYTCKTQKIFPESRAPSRTS